MAHLKIIVGLLILTVTVLLNTRPAEAADCAAQTDCKHNGTCPTPVNSAPCDCSKSKYIGDTCEDNVCTTNADCQNDGTCNTDGTPNVCECKDGFEGKTCADKSGASTVTTFSLMTLFVVLTGNIL